MHQRTIKILLTSVLVLFGLIAFPQDSGTFKVAKSKVKYRSSNKLIGFSTTLGDNLSPKRIRSYNLKVGFFWDLQSNVRHILIVGLSGGKANPSDKYNGFTSGLFTRYNSFKLNIAHFSISFPVEVSYKKLFNNLANGNLNQYCIAVGLNTPLFFFHNAKLIFWGKYNYEQNSTDIIDGFYPSFEINYPF